MTTTTTGAPTLRLTEHPLQRCGARALTELAGQHEPHQVTPEDMDRAEARIINDVVAAATAPREAAGYDWWKVLFTLYPNAKPTHAKRERTREGLHPQVQEMFAPDQDTGVLRPCTFCGTRCSVLWAKATLPMFDSVRAVNTLPPGVAGWPVCRSCRLAMWALPYGAWVAAGSATVLTCDNPEVERAFVARNTLRARRIHQFGFSGLRSGAGPEAVALQALRKHAADAPAATALWMFKNDNQEPWLKTSGTRTGVARFLHRMLADRDCQSGWKRLRHALERRDSSGAVTLSGATGAARTLFDADLQSGDRLLSELWRRAARTEEYHWSTLWQWRALAALYAEVMYEVDNQQLRPAATLVARWIAAESSRGRFNEYRQVAGSAYHLHKLLMTAGARLYLNGEAPADITNVAPELLASGQHGWRNRGLLFFEVLAELRRLEVSIGTAADAEEDDDKDPLSDGDDEEDA
ncbi:CRISPR-associated protein Cst1 [Haloactinospora alba]|uniref:CRISPR-associated protein Cst1 n=1 Tax=Haloactinospora alba TaxID=405555 RepID=A0A543NEM5_9ACTN|nr:hypothetical protein [Haloactinospora alba]TQN30266.1 CRISPR-associated protein Cst1 [Haloactinospora alba]